MIKLLNSTIFLFLLFTACQSQTEQGIQKVDASKLQELQDAGVTVIDIRTPGEFTQGHISGVLHIDYMQDSFFSKMEEVSKTEPIVIYCASGGRSGKAAKELHAAGFKTIYDYSGGMSDWMSQNLPIEK